MLRLSGTFYAREWRGNDSPVIAYASYNIGRGRFNRLLKNFNNSVYYKSRSRLSLIDWFIHYEIRKKEYLQIRANANKFYIALHGFKDFIKGNLK